MCTVHGQSLTCTDRQWIFCSGMGVMFMDTQLNCQSRPNWCVERVHLESFLSSGKTCMKEQPSAHRSLIWN